MEPTRISLAKNIYRWLGLLLAIVGAFALILSGVLRVKVALILVGVSFFLSGISWFLSPMWLGDTFFQKDRQLSQGQVRNEKISKGCAASAAFLLVVSLWFVFFQNL